MPNKSKKRGDSRKKGGGNFDYLQPLSSRALRRETRSTVRGQIRPIKRQIKSEKKASDQRVGEIRGYFEGPDGYLATVDDSKASTDAKYQQTLAQIAAQTGATAAQGEALRAKLEAEDKADAALRGASYDPSEARTAEQAALSRRTASDTTYGTVAGQGAAQYGYLTDKARIGKGEMGEQISDERARGRTFDSDLRDLKREAGDLRTEVRGTLIGRERELALANRAFEKPSASARSQKQLARLYGKNTKREQNRSLRNQLAVGNQQASNAAADDARSRRYLKKQSKLTGGGKGGGISKGDVRRGAAYLRTEAGKKKPAFSNPKGGVDYLINRGVDPKAARQAVKKVRKQDKRHSRPIAGTNYRGPRR